MGSPKASETVHVRKPFITPRRTGVVVVLFWLIMMGLFIKREGLMKPFGNSNRESATQRVLKPSDTWMGVFLADGTRVGFINTANVPEVRDTVPGLATSVMAKLHLTLLASPMDVVISGTVWTPQSGESSQFDFSLLSDEHSMHVTAMAKDGRLEGSILTAGEPIPISTPIGKNFSLSGAMGATTLNIPALRVGEETQVDTFDPMTFSSGTAHVRCIGEETVTIAGQQVAARVVTTDLNGLTSKAWVGADGEILQAETPFGFSMRKITQEEAMKPIEGTGGSSLLQAVAIKPTGKKPFRGAKRMVVRLSGTKANRTPPESDVLHATADGIVLTMPAAPAEPYAMGGTEPETLQSDALVQSDHVKIKEMAASIVGEEKDPWKRSQLLFEWVYINIAKKSVFSVPSALEVLKSREGDCNEHTTLYTALARSLEIPTRMAIGVVWSDELDGFFYHAWPEVHIGRWIPIDPTLGQPLADATHLALLYGDIERWTQLIPYLGQLKMEIVSIE